MGVGALGVVAVLGMALADGDVAAWERETTAWLNDVPESAGWLARIVMQAGTRGAVVVAAALTALWWRRAAPALAVLVAGVPLWWLVDPIKEAVGRRRPSYALDGVDVLDPASGFGYPSAHTAIAAAIAVALLPVLGRTGRVLVLLVVAVVGLARLHVGAHFPLDAIGGALLGVGTGSIGGMLNTDARRTDRPAGG